MNDMMARITVKNMHEAAPWVASIVRFLGTLIMASNSQWLTHILLSLQQFVMGRVRAYLVEDGIRSLKRIMKKEVGTQVNRYELVYLLNNFQRIWAAAGPESYQAKLIERWMADVKKPEATILLLRNGIVYNTMTREDYDLKRL